MKIGILNAIQTTKSSINWNNTPVDTYIRFFESVQAPFEYVGYDLVAGEFPESPAACDAFVVTGSSSGVYDADEWIAPLSDFIRDCFEAKKKLVGICFGHQILAHALGGYVAKSEKGWGLGLQSIDLAGSPAWMNNVSGQCSLYFVHQDQVMTLPPNARHLGGNNFCPNAFFAIGNQVLGMQGHPEFTIDIMQDILFTKNGNAEPQTYDRAFQSLQNGKPDNQLVARWVVNFLLE